MIERLVDPDLYLQFARDNAHPGSLLLISTVDRDACRGPGSMEAPNREHVREWSQPEFRRYLESRGFRVLEQKAVPPYRRGASWKMWKEWWRTVRKGRAVNNLQRALCEVT